MGSAHRIRSVTLETVVAIVLIAAPAACYITLPVHELYKEEVFIRWIFGQWKIGG